jgi:glycosyltransferase involved in cell wall biosynthesis
VNSKKSDKINVCIVLPAYNESSVIGEVIKGLDKVFSQSTYYFEIVVVDDGSNDETFQLASKSGAKTIRHILNIGSGGATATGLSYAQQKGFDIAATVDADGQHDPHDVLTGVNKLIHSDIDLLIGSRLIIKEGMSKFKVLGNRGLTFITFLLFGISVTDSQSGLRIFSKRALNTLRWKTSGYEFCSEMLWRAKQIGLKIDEFPVKAIYTDYSISKGQNNWNAFNIIATLLRRRLLELFNE